MKNFAIMVLIVVAFAGVVAAAVAGGHKYDHPKSVSTK